jgi:hypothetical protein
VALSGRGCCWCRCFGGFTARPERDTKLARQTSINLLGNFSDNKVALSFAEEQKTTAEQV